MPGFGDLAGKLQDLAQSAVEKLPDAAEPLIEKAKDAFAEADKQELLDRAKEFAPRALEGAKKLIGD